MKRSSTHFLSLLLALFMLLAPPMTVSWAEETQPPEEAIDIDPYATTRQIEAGITISSGTAHCTGTIRLWSGYHAQVTMNLLKNGSVIKTWRYSITTSSTVDLEETATAYSGNTYQVTISAIVYDSTNHIVEYPSASSAVINY